jgi:hypothetical protein
MRVRALPSGKGWGFIPSWVRAPCAEDSAHAWATGFWLGLGWLS